MLLHEAGQVQSRDDLRPNFKGFFERYFAVAGAPYKYPYYLPFGPVGNPAERFFNRNVAGSYAQSSIRAVNPLRRIATIETTPTGPVWDLNPEHAAVAHQLLEGRTLPAASLAAYLYRDFSFSGAPTPGDLYLTLQADFGFAFPSEGVGFGDVFTDDTIDLGPNPFELRVPS